MDGKLYYNRESKTSFWMYETFNFGYWDNNSVLNKIKFCISNT